MRTTQNLKADKIDNVRENRNFPWERMGTVIGLKITKSLLVWDNDENNRKERGGGAVVHDFFNRVVKSVFMSACGVNLPLPMIPASLFRGIYL